MAELTIVDVMDGAERFVMGLSNVTDVSTDNDHKSGEVLFRLDGEPYAFKVRSGGDGWNLTLEESDWDEE